jgi:hypothetical protein
MDRKGAFSWQLVLLGENPVVRKNLSGRISCILDLGQDRLGGEIHNVYGGYVAPYRDSNSYHSPSQRAPPNVEDLVLDLDFNFLDSPNESPDQADQSQELTYVDIDTFLASF